MAYRAPNAYARFVKTAGAVASPGSTRIMALVGTGLNYYEVYNETIQRSTDKPFDLLANENIFEILNVSSKPISNGKQSINSVVYKQGEHFEIKNGKQICWNLLEDHGPVFSKSYAPNEGSSAFDKKVTVVVDDNSKHFVEDGEWLIEVSYVHEKLGTYKVINNLTKEQVGEYTVSKQEKLNIIPGLKLTVETTFILDENNQPLTNVGDYVIIKTTAGKTEIEPKVLVKEETFTTGIESSKYLYNLKIENQMNIQPGIYTITFNKSELDIVTLKITKDGDIDFNQSCNVGLFDYLDIIPGVNFKLKDIDPADITTGDIIKIEVVDKIAGNTPAEGSSYYVSYKYKKAEEEYDPKLFFDYDDIANEYGNYDVTASGLVINSLSLGAEIAFSNGVGSLICVQAKNDSDYEINKAIDKLKRTLPGIDNVNTIVPLSSSQDVGSYAANHVTMMSEESVGKERMVYLGAYPGQELSKSPTALDRSYGMVEIAKSFNNERVVYVVPGELTKDIRDLRTGKINERKLPACYAAVAVACLGLVNDPAEPLTNKAISGFKYLTSMLMESEKNLLAGSGCLVLDQRGTNIIVRHGITTSATDVNSAEITLVQIKDYIIDALRKATAAQYVGQKNKPGIVKDIEYTVSSILDQFISQEIILSVNGLTVKRSPLDPRQVDVKFEVEAVYPLNYISISFGFSVTS